MPTGQYVPGNSAIHKLDARVKIVCLFLLLAAIVVSSSVCGYVLVFFITFTLVLLAKLSFKIALASIRRLWLFFIVILLMNGLFYDSTAPFWSWGIINISFEGVRQGTRVVLNVVFIMILGNVLTSTTTPIDMTTSLSNLMRPLRLIRIPVEDVAMIISIAIQFIPTLLEEADTIKKAQIARGARFESKKLAERAMSFLPLIIPLFLSAFRRADELSIAMETRGYRNARDRTKKARIPLCQSDLLALAFSFIVCLIQIHFLS